MFLKIDWLIDGILTWLSFFVSFQRKRSVCRTSMWRSPAAHDVIQMKNATAWQHMALQTSATIWPHMVVAREIPTTQLHSGPFSEECVCFWGGGRNLGISPHCSQWRPAGSRCTARLTGADQSDATMTSVTYRGRRQREAWHAAGEANKQHECSSKYWAWTIQRKK